MSVIFHHYVDGAASTLIADAPAAKSVTKAVSRIFAAFGETVKYCAIGDARDWTTADDAGFLPVQLQQDTGDVCTAVGTYQNKLAVFFPTSAQTWTVAPDPTANAIDQRLFGIGTLAPLSQAGFANDLAFLSPFGFRSMTVRAQTDRVDDTDVGVQIDTLVKPDMEYVEALGAIGLDPLGVWIHELGQYWCIFDSAPDPSYSGITGTTSKIWAYSYSRSSKVACWSEYTLPIRVTGVCSLNGKVYLRDADKLYLWDEEAFTDDGTAISVEVQMAFQNAKTPGVDKQFYGADYVFEGAPSISFKYDPRDQTKETIPQQVDGDTAPGTMIPVEVVAPSIAPVFRHSANEAFELSQISVYYNPLTVT